MPDTPLGLTYPDAQAHTRLWEHFQNLADDVDAQLTVIGGGPVRIAHGRIAHGAAVTAGWKARVTFDPGWFLANIAVAVTLTSYEGQPGGWVLEGSPDVNGFTVQAVTPVIPRIAWMAVQTPRFSTTYTVV